MASPVRFPSGVASGVKGSALFSLPMLDPTKVHWYYNDFNEYVAADWTVTEVGVATQALSDGSFGELLVTNAAADNDSSQNQKIGESFRLDVPNKKFWGKMRFKVSDAIQSDLLIGLAVTDTTLLGAIDGTGVTDGIFIAKEDGDANLDFYVQKNATTGQLATVAFDTLVTDTYISLGFAYDGNRYVKIYSDDVHVATADLTATPSTYLPDTDLTVSFSIQNGEAVAKTMTVDYVFFAVER